MADMTAFFGVKVDDRGHRTGSWSSTTRPRRSSPTPRIRGRKGTSRGGSDESRASGRSWISSKRRSRRRATSSCARCEARLNALRERDAELADEVIAFDDEVDARALERRAAGRVGAGPPDTGRGRPAPRARDPAHQPPPRADGRPVREHREDGEGRAHDRPADADVVVEGFEEMGSRAEEMTRVALESFRLRRSHARGVAGRARRADRPLEPARRRRARPARGGRGAPGVGAAHDRRLSLPRADRRQRGRHRRADRVPRQRRLPRVTSRRRPSACPAAERGQTRGQAPVTVRRDGAREPNAPEISVAR